MGKKYIIEKDDNESIWSIYADANGDATIEGVSLTPYTEPDLEQVNAEKDALYDEARARGYDEGRARGYQEGLFDAWEAAKKIALDKEDGGLDTAAYCETFGYGKGFGTVLKTYTASEAIEKIQQYEQEKEEQDGLRQNIQTIVDQCGYSLDEIAEVLQKMKKS